jgi:DNA repair photolyase
MHQVEEDMVKCRECGEEIIFEELLAVEDELNALARHWRRCHPRQYYRMTREMDRETRRKLAAMLEW